MPINKESLIKRIDELLGLADRTLASERKVEYMRFVDPSLANEFRSASLSFLVSCVSSDHVYYREFNTKVEGDPGSIREGQGILRAFRSEIDADWFLTVRALVSADIFSDHLDMASHLLEEGYKDPAAVLTGGALEGHLRFLAENRQIPITYSASNGNIVPKKADGLNAELYKAGAYNSLDQKAVLSWLDLRNKAAHGQYIEYSTEQVSLMLNSVRAFLQRVSS
ncbi:MAG: hypothetical protein Q8K61_06955 [Gallionella sp.]|nr:hypothetical protein [Gallionella sp.]